MIVPETIEREEREREANGDELNELTQQVNSLQSDKDELKTQLEDANRATIEYKLQADELKEKITTIEAQLRELETNKLKLEQDAKKKANSHIESLTKIADLEQRLAKMNAENVDTKKKTESIVHQFEKLNTELTAATDKWKSLESENKTLIKKNEEICNKSKSDELNHQEMYRKYEEKMEQLKGEKRQSKNESSNLSKLLKETEAKIQEINKELHMKKEVIDENEKNLRALNEKCREMVDEVEESKKKHKDYEEIIKQLNCKIVDLKQANETLKNNFQINENEFSKLSEKYETEIDELKKMNQTNLQELTQQIKETESLEENIVKLKSENSRIQKLFDESSKLVIENNQQKSTETEKENEVEALLDKAYKDIREKNENLGALQEQKLHLLGEIDKLLAKISSKEEENSSKSESLHQKEIVIQTLLTEKENLEKKCDSLKNQLTENTHKDDVKSGKKIRELTDELINKNQDLDKLSKEKSILEKEIEQLKSEIQNLKSKFESEISNLKTNEKERQDELESLRSERSSMKEKCETIEKELIRVTLKRDSQTEPQVEEEITETVRSHDYTQPNNLSSLNDSEDTELKMQSHIKKLETELLILQGKYYDLKHSSITSDDHKHHHKLDNEVSDSSITGDSSVTTIDNATLYRTENHSHLLESIEKLNAEISEQRLKNQTLDKEMHSKNIEDLQKSFSDSSSEKNRLKSEFDKLRKDHEILNANYKSLSEKLAAIKDQATPGNTEDLGPLENQLRQYQEENNQLRTQLEHYRETLEKTESCLQKIQSSVDQEENNWKVCLKSSTEEQERLEGKVKELLQQIEDLKNEKNSDSMATIKISKATKEEERKVEREFIPAQSRRFLIAKDEFIQDMMENERKTQIIDLEKQVNLLQMEIIGWKKTVNELKIKCKESSNSSKEEIVESDQTEIYRELESCYNEIEVLQIHKTALLEDIKELKEKMKQRDKESELKIKEMNIQIMKLEEIKIGSGKLNEVSISKEDGKDDIYKEVNWAEQSQDLSSQQAVIQDVISKVLYSHEAALQNDIENLKSELNKKDKEIKSQIQEKNMEIKKLEDVKKQLERNIEKIINEERDIGHFVCGRCNDSTDNPSDIYKEYELNRCDSIAIENEKQKLILEFDVLRKEMNNKLERFNDELKEKSNKIQNMEQDKVQMESEIERLKRQYRENMVKSVDIDSDEKVVELYKELERKNLDVMDLRNDKLLLTKEINQLKSELLELEIKLVNWSAMFRDKSISTEERISDEVVEEVFEAQQSERQNVEVGTFIEETKEKESELKTQIIDLEKQVNLLQMEIVVWKKTVNELKIKCRESSKSSNEETVDSDQTEIYRELESCYNEIEMLKSHKTALLEDLESIKFLQIVKENDYFDQMNEKTHLITNLEQEISGLKTCFDKLSFEFSKDRLCSSSYDRNDFTRLNSYEMEVDRLILILRDLQKKELEFRRMQCFVDYLDRSRIENIVKLKSDFERGYSFSDDGDLNPLLQSVSPTSNSFTEGYHCFDAMSSMNKESLPEGYSEHKFHISKLEEEFRVLQGKYFALKAELNHQNQENDLSSVSKNLESKDKRTDEEITEESKMEKLMLDLIEKLEIEISEQRQKNESLQQTLGDMLVEKNNQSLLFKELQNKYDLIRNQFTKLSEDIQSKSCSSLEGEDQMKISTEAALLKFENENEKIISESNNYRKTIEKLETQFQSLKDLADLQEENWETCQSLHEENIKQVEQKISDLLNQNQENDPEDKSDFM